MKPIAWIEFPDCGPKNRKPGKSLVITLSWGDEARSSRIPRCHFCRAEYQREEGYKEKTLEMCWGTPQVFSWPTHVCEQTIQEPTLKGSDGIIPKAHIGWKWLLLFPLIRVENLIINRTLDRVFRRVLSQ